MANGRWGARPSDRAGARDMVGDAGRVTHTFGSRLAAANASSKEKSERGTEYWQQKLQEAKKVYEEAKG